MILERGMFRKRVLLKEKGTFICLKSVLRMKGTLIRRVLLIENREYVLVK